jgi:hypothetical protein
MDIQAFTAEAVSDFSFADVFCDRLREIGQASGG